VKSSERVGSRRAKFGREKGQAEGVCGGGVRMSEGKVVFFCRKRGGAGGVTGGGNRA